MDNENRTADGLLGAIGALLQPIGCVVYFGMGIIQLFAIVDGLGYWFGFPTIINFILALVLAYLPLVGQIAGFVGATNVWGWEWYWAGLLFFWPFLLMALFYSIVGIVTATSRKP